MAYSESLTRFVAQLFIRSQSPGAAVQVSDACSRHLPRVPEAHALLAEVEAVRTTFKHREEQGGQTEEAHAVRVKRAVLATMRRNVVAFARLLSARLTAGDVQSEAVSALSLEVLRVPWLAAATDGGTGGNGGNGGTGGGSGEDRGGRGSGSGNCEQQQPPQPSQPPSFLSPMLGKQI